MEAKTKKDSKKKEKKALVVNKMSVVSLFSHLMQERKTQIGCKEWYKSSGIYMKIKSLFKIKLR